jgi:hypothetical protein
MLYINKYPVQGLRLSNETAAPYTGSKLVKGLKYVVRFFLVDYLEQ